MILTTLEERRRARRRMALSLRTSAVGVNSARASRWFLGE